MAAKLAHRMSGGRSTVTALNRYVIPPEVAEMLNLSIDVERKRISASVLLAGESEPIEVAIEDYRIEQHGDRATITIGAVEVDREWIAQLARRLLVGKSVDLPTAVVEYIDLLR